jgi:trans-2,3-dihydro-3-hydroxyanthranilate isomerase
VEIPFRLIDVFTDRPLAGNQLCVVPDPPRGLTDELMQAIAREIGFSETTFVTGAAGDRYAMRIFTPGMEIPFGGHPTLGTAFLLAAEGRISSPVTQVVEAGEFRVEVDVSAGRARVLQHPPEFGPEAPALAPLAKAVGLVERDLREDLWPQAVSTGMAHLMVAVKDADAVARARPDGDAIAPILDEVDADALYLFAVCADGRAKARMFATDLGIAEDPATGSAAGPLGAYLARAGVAGMPGSLLIYQGEEVGRPSELHVEVTPKGDTFDVWVEGGVAIVGRGAFEVDD